MGRRDYVLQTPTPSPAAGARRARRPRLGGTRLRRSLVAFLTVAVFALVSSVGSGSTTASAQSSDVGSYLSQINALRASVGAPPLQLDGTLNSLAQGWAQHLADQGSL